MIKLVIEVEMRWLVNHDMCNVILHYEDGPRYIVMD